MAEELMRNIQWFPGHMTKTRRMIAANLSLVDAVVEILDARVPQSSRNPEMDSMVGSKPLPRFSASHAYSSSVDFFGAAFAITVSPVPAAPA